jgi:hypothetical protein
MLPDIERAVVARLSGTLSGTHVGLDLDERRPAVTISVAGGGPDAPGKPDRPRIQIDTWADDPATARTLAYAVEAALVCGITDSGWHAGGVAVSDCRLVTRPLRLDDPVAGTPRYTIMFELHAR